MSYLSPSFALYFEMQKPNDIKTGKGRPGRATVILQKMNNQLSDTGKYVVHELTTKLDRKLWNEQEIIDAITDDGLKDIKFLKPGGDKNLTDEQKKSKATEIRKAIVQRRHDIQAEVVKTLETGAPKGKAKFIFASEFMKENIKKASESGKSSLMIEKSMTDAMRALKDIGKSDPKFDYKESDWLNFKSTSTMNVNNFMSKLINNIVNKLSGALDEYDDSFDDKTKNYLWMIVDNIQEANRNIMWPDWNHDITNFMQLEQYFEFLRSDKEIKRGDKVLNQLNKGIGYKKKGRLQKENKNDNYDKEFLKLMYEATSETKGLAFEDNDFDKKIKQLSTQFLKEHKWLKQYIMETESMPEDSDLDDVGYELMSLMAFNISKLRQKLGRKHNI